MKMDLQKWKYKVIPMPKKFDIENIEIVSKNDVALDFHLTEDKKSIPEINTAIKMIECFSNGKQDTSKFLIRMYQTKDLNNEDFGGIKEQLLSLPNKEQAYAILPAIDKKGLCLIGVTPLGLLYAARTLVQLIEESNISSELQIPIVNIIDWPDIAERGQWGGNSDKNINWTSKWKLNVVEANANVMADDDGLPKIAMKPELISNAKAEGVKIVPYILHLEQISIFANINKEMHNTPDPSKPLPSDYFPGLCMSSSATQKWIELAMEKIASNEDVTDITVWLSEDSSPCFCPKCIGKEPYILEVECIVKSFRAVQKKYPNLKLRILSSQGSYPVNDKILAVLPDDVGLIYYDGGRTYDSSRKPMIYPLLEEYSKSGGWLGVYPQITHCWRTVFPWIAPQFIKYRAQEFVNKKLDCVIGYAVPSNYFHEFNVMAWAEWTWNSEGRTVEEFLKAYAYKTGICDPDAFSQWGMKNGMAGWILAESRLFLTLIYNPSLNVQEKPVPSDHRFEMAKIAYREDIDEAIKMAEEALGIARQSGQRRLELESEAILAGLKALKTLKTVLDIYCDLSYTDKNKLKHELDILDNCAFIIRNSILEWGEQVCAPIGEKLPTRLLDTAFVLLRTCDALRKWASNLGIEDPLKQNRLKRIEEWSASDFECKSEITKEIDLKDILKPEGGEYQIAFDFIQSAYGADIKEIAVYDYNHQPGEKPVKLAETQDILKRVSIWERWCEMRLDIPPIGPDAKPVLCIKLGGLPEDAPEDRRTCSGTIGIRYVSSSLK